MDNLDQGPIPSRKERVEKQISWEIANHIRGLPPVNPEDVDASGVLLPSKDRPINRLPFRPHYLSEKQFNF